MLLILSQIHLSVGFNGFIWPLLCLILLIISCILYRKTNSLHKKTQEKQPKINILLIATEPTTIKTLCKRYSNLFDITVTESPLPQQIDSAELIITEANKPFEGSKPSFCLSPASELASIDLYIIQTMLGIKEPQPSNKDNQDKSANTFYTQDALVEKCKKLVSDNIDNPELSVNELARLCNLTPYLLNKSLKQATGVVASTFIKTIRFEKAAEGLISSNKTIAEIAYSIGCNDMKYFRESFIKLYGTTPSQYRINAK